MITFRAKGNTIDPISEEEAGKQSRRDQSHVCPVSSLECLYHRYCTEDDRCKPHQYDKRIFKVCIIMEHVPIESCREPKQQKGRNQIHSNSFKLFHYSARPSSKRAGFYAYYAISRIGLLPEIPLEQASERLAVTGLSPKLENVLSQRPNSHRPCDALPATNGIFEPLRHPSCLRFSSCGIETHDDV